MNFPCVSSMSDPVPPLWKPMEAKQIPALPETLALAGTDIIFPARSWCSAVGFRIRNPLLRNRCCGYLKSRTLSFPYSAIQTQQEGIRTATHPNELSTSIPPDTIPTCGIPTSLRTPHHGLLYLSWFSKFSSFLLQDRPVFPQSFPKTTLDPTRLCRIQGLLFKLSAPTPHLLPLGRFELFDYTALSIFHIASNDEPNWNAESTACEYCIVHQVEMESKPPLTKIFTVTEKRVSVKLQLKLHHCINSRSSEMRKTAMQIIPLARCVLYKGLTEKCCEFWGRKTYKTQTPKPQMILQQCEPDDTYQPCTIPNPA